MPEEEKPSAEATPRKSTEPPSVAAKILNEAAKQGESMEIHTPDKPIHSRKEFLFHMFTVVLGILIALGMEGIVEWFHHRALVHEARENIAAEVRKNKEIVDATIPEIHKRQDELSHIIDVMRHLEKDRNAFKHGSMSFNTVNHDLYSTAWQTATVSGAVTYMKYEELTRYTDVYITQQAFTSLQDQALNRMIEMGSRIEVTMREDDLKKVPVEKFQAIAQEAYKDVIIQQTLEGISTSLSKAYSDLLKSK